MSNFRTALDRLGLVTLGVVLAVTHDHGGWSPFFAALCVSVCILYPPAYVKRGQA